MSLAVLITVFNRCEQTLRCLANLYSQELPQGVQLAVYLVEDGCNDGTAEAVQEQFPEVNLIHGDGSLYWNRGMYTAWQAAAQCDYDFYLWLNDDTFVYPDMISQLLQAAEKTQKKAIVVGSTLDTARSHITYGAFRRGSGLQPPNGQLQKADYFNGNIVLVPRTVYQRLGNLDHYFRHSKGDFDYGLRARKAGIDIFIAPHYLGECDEHPSLDTWCNPEVPLRRRLRMLYRPNGMPPNETFYLERRHLGLAQAIFHYLTVHLRCLLPKLWQMKSRDRSHR